MLIPFEGHEPQVADDAYIAPTVVLIGRVRIASGASVWFNSVLRGDINSIDIGENSNIQDGCLLHVTNKHQLIVGERVTVGHGAILHGCRIESDCLIAMGAVVLDHAVVGHGSIVAAGAVVSPGKEIPPYSLVMGVPGKVIRSLSEDDRTQIERGWQNYCQYSRIYKSMKINSN
ncbi:MAG: gamma carbonic anhydrase family protein [Leptolyngbya sp.]|nr:gamma carbonic anhydrase family protein [Candidatus Melainabacteria bacterium]